MATVASGLHPVAAGGATIVAAKLPLVIAALLSILVLAIACAITPPTDTPAPLPTFTPDPLATPDIAAILVSSTAATIAAIPTNTPVETEGLTPEPAQPIRTGWATGWEYYGVDCPDNDPSCVTIGAHHIPDCPDNDPDCDIPDIEFIVVGSNHSLRYHRPSEHFAYEARLIIACGVLTFRGMDVVSDTVPVVGTDETLLGVWLAGSENQDKQYFTPEYLSITAVMLLLDDYKSIISLIRLAEARKQTLVISAIAGVDPEPVIGLFDVTGFTAYYNRLAC